jgi:membrane protease YdiL (CAAX protease family)
MSMEPTGAIVPEAAPDSTPGRPLAVWPVFALYFAAIAAAVAAQMPVVVGMVVIKVASGEKPETVLDFLGTPWGLIAVSIGPQLAILGLWWLATRFGDPRARGNVAIGASPLSGAATACAVLATPGLLWLGEPLGKFGLWLFGEWQAKQFENLYENISWASGLALVAFIALAPAFVEELFFRGYMQRRLLARWSPLAAVPVVGVLFAAMHGTPAWALAILPLGLWFGVLAWRTGSLWPGIFSHAFINGSVNLWRVGASLGAWSSEPSPAVYYSVLGASLACLLVSLWVLFKLPPPDLSESGSLPGTDDGRFGDGGRIAGSSPRKSAIESTTTSGR